MVFGDDDVPYSPALLDAWRRPMNDCWQNCELVKGSRDLQLVPLRINSYVAEIVGHRSRLGDWCFRNLVLLELSYPLNKSGLFYIYHTSELL